MIENVKIIDLPLKKEWFDMIANGEKHEEYREMKPHWLKRLSIYDNNYNILSLNPNHYSHVRFRYGYTKRTMLFKIKCISIGRGNPEWGAPVDKNVFIIKF